MAQWVKVLAVKTDCQGLIPGPYAVEEGKYMGSSPRSLCPTRVHCSCEVVLMELPQQQGQDGHGNSYSSI